MKLEEKLEKLRKSYIAIHPRDEFAKRGWHELYERLETKPKPSLIFAPALARSLVFAALLLFILTGGGITLVQAAQRSLPGEPFYPVKRLSEDIGAKLTANSRGKVENRGQEIIDLVKKDKDSQRLEKAAQEYEKIVSETKQEIEKSGKGEEEFEKILKEQEKQFEEAIKKGSSSQNQLEEAIDVAQSGRNGGEDQKEDHSGSNSGSN
ncbi:hypothetical protein A3H87_04855 [Candidatus Curtissbacteria bacterium RIFCSPLOWO2_02_FULL_42_37]|uniref:DUF5667 domain-containing protein n=1 Tax=Candidatus Curtissbacteria bacterium RIFCSPLOWO2_01_FULL_42_50 TaxID=1797730 RepID=A0A1F5H3Z5_9BACT|nr:MAG: hypothetical protein A3E71_01635 [Candidatus Curtissbacteria bacterium RIFCSPHIGHO2_12_FULL_42_33]OGD98831.1 MAG: hypothetical protein A3B54_01645 [Candidatus Curtissbacteria bacterium RIFCSPLOWO2_01_FULL_42_50]OGE03243.1 MAG: hypothetical protein A3G16_01690 [Candidatus Curtissbacteria bacterium RIFCSPLOWO2_12_FULL_41_16]OGE11661.1 MAG: hypothetical protein A3H87_04855 [Candidatus Curtissbacteria bacterium RIFCSPLOWO2_02_FULL_42_37]